MKRKDLIKAVSIESGHSQKVTEEVFESIISVISKTLRKEEPVVIPGFGNFSVRERAARMGINPKTLAAIRIEATKVVRFKASPVLKLKD